MLISTASFASVFVLIIGALIVWSNPSRLVNRAVGMCSLHWAAWLGCLHVASHMHGGLPWLRLSCAVGAFLPMDFWVVNEVVAGKWGSSKRGPDRWLAIWTTVSLVLAAACFTRYFIPTPIPGAPHVRGWAYDGYVVAFLALTILVLFRAVRSLRGLSGARRIELQVWLLGGCGMALTLLVAMVLTAVTKYRLFTELQPLFVLAFYAGTAFTITTFRIFDSGQILRIAANRLILAGAVGGAAYASYVLATPEVSPSVAVLLVIVTVLVCTPVLKGLLDRWFEFYPQDKAARLAAFNAAQTESRLEQLEERFLDILRGWGQADHAIVLTEERTESVQGGQAGIEMSPAFQTLGKLGWVTPERLARERSSSEGQVLGPFLDENRLGIAVYSGSPLFGIVVGVGLPASRRPFTYPQVTQLLELAAIIEGAFERKVLAMRIQHAEQLATVGVLGASLAHEIRNPLVSIKAIVQLLPSRYEEPAFREKFFRLISDEVVRIDRMTEQLLDLASPRVYTAQKINLNEVIRTSLELVMPRAAEKRVKLARDLKALPDQAFTDPAAVTQVLLNLCFNAIQALDLRASEREVAIATRNVPGGIEMSVTDNGPGLSAEVRARMFRPFHTTKSSGFGLGLTICRDILVGLKAGISVDTPVPGQGATFRVTFPCPPSLS
jgi:signal transduction histidine kinase